MIVDIHSHVPTHRDVVPPDERIENAKWRPDRVVAATTTWADYDAAFAEVDVSVAFTIARDRTRVDTLLNDRVAEFVASLRACAANRGGAPGAGASEPESQP